MEFKQAKVLGMKNTIDVFAFLSTMEKDLLIPLGWLTELKTTYNQKVEGLRNVSMILSLDQTQGTTKKGEDMFLGFGATNSDQAFNNGLFYAMKVNEKGEGKGVNGTITYTLTKRLLNGIEYAFDKDYNYPSGQAFQLDYTFTYGNKSQRNSTFWKWFRMLAPNLIINLSFVSPFMVAIEAKKAPKEEVQENKEKVSISVPQLSKAEKARIAREEKAAKKAQAVSA